MLKIILETINTLLSNFTLAAVVTSWFLAQVIKIGVYWIRDGELNFWHFFEAGGMPSAHSAAVTAVTLGVGLTLGWHTALFTACLVFALIVMYDATGVRRAAGVGHSPLEVMAGAGLAILTTLILYYFYF